MKKFILIAAAVLLLVIALSLGTKNVGLDGVTSPAVDQRVWQVKSIDTMKYSRDKAGQAQTDATFDSTIDTQVKAIVQTGANTVAIATPYDSEFVPVLARWVAAARRYNLHVWFRGNFSGWEGWFGHDKGLTRDDHQKMLEDFITSNPTLFRDGDYLSPCPECENGGAGDPRETGDVSGFRSFMTGEKQTCDSAFEKIGKKVDCSLWPMNYDVAKVVMDPVTAKAMGGVVVIDHYVDKPQQLVTNIDTLAKQSGAKIFLGEMGAPIPDINGDMTDAQQADWLDTALSGLATDKNVIGLNYWTSFGGSTAIFNDDGSPKPAVAKLANYFKLTALPN